MDIGIYMDRELLTIQRIVILLNARFDAAEICDWRSKRYLRRFKFAKACRWSIHAWHAHKEFDTLCKLLTDSGYRLSIRWNKNDKGNLVREFVATNGELVIGCPTGD